MEGTTIHQIIFVLQEEVAEYMDGRKRNVNDGEFSVVCSSSFIGEGGQTIKMR
jgi:hypothetical protein